MGTGQTPLKLARNGMAALRPSPGSRAVYPLPSHPSPGDEYVACGRGSSELGRTRRRRRGEGGLAARPSDLKPNAIALHIDDHTVSLLTGFGRHNGVWWPHHRSCNPPTRCAYSI